MGTKKQVFSRTNYKFRKNAESSRRTKGAGSMSEIISLDRGKLDVKEAFTSKLGKVFKSSIASAK